MMTKRAIFIPAILLIYLVVMVVLGWPSYLSGATSPILYFGGTALCVGCIVALHFHLKARAHRQTSIARTARR